VWPARCWSGWQVRRDRSHAGAGHVRRQGPGSPAWFVSQWGRGVTITTKCRQSSLARSLTRTPASDEGSTTTLTSMFLLSGVLVRAERGTPRVMGVAAVRAGLPPASENAAQNMHSPSKNTHTLMQTHIFRDGAGDDAAEVGGQLRSAQCEWGGVGGGVELQGKNMRNVQLANTGRALGTRFKRKLQGSSRPAGKRAARFEASVMFLGEHTYVDSNRAASHAHSHHRRGWQCLGRRAGKRPARGAEAWRCAFEWVGGVIRRLIALALFLSFDLCLTR
jgi:hypothetical protein